MQRHWVDKLLKKIKDERGVKERYVFNSGMSVSGMMHIGNLRGELLIPSSIKKVLGKEGKEVNFRGVYYTQDRFKAKGGQLQQFENPEEAKKYKGWRLIDVPDPEGCHENWVEHFNSENHPFLKEFGIDVDPIATTEFYEMEETKKLVKTFLENKERVRKVLNKFRERNPYPEGWVPFDPLCVECNRIDNTEALKIDFEGEKVKYRCNKCGNGGWSDFQKGKLRWRLEWTSLWEVLDVDFEPFGKDHATPGGSRDSCIALAKEFELNYPTGFAFNWVYWKVGDEVREMTSSGNIGMTAKDYLEVAEPEILNYLYLSTKPMKEIYFKPDDIPTYYRRFDRAEAIYFGEEEARSEKREMNIKRNYELAMEEIPKKKPLRPSYQACSFVAQLTDTNERALELLRKMEEVPEKISKKDEEKVIQRLENARNWLEKFSPGDYLIQVQEDTSEIEDKLSSEQKETLVALREELETKEWTASGLQNRIYDMKEEFDLSAEEVFQAIYLAVLGEKSGPRAGQLIKAAGQDKVAEILEEL